MGKLLPIAMSYDQAVEIAGQLGKTSKMPGRSYGLDAFLCITGSHLANVEGSTCERCYARNNFYRTWWPTRMNRAKHHEALPHPRWVDAMVVLISVDCRDAPWFRWHDSGDLMSVKHLANICEVARRTPHVHHWLPTREYTFVDEYLRWGGKVPANLCIRVSALFVDQAPDVPELLAALPTSTVHTTTPVAVGTRRGDSIACLAPLRANTCGKCRACWSPRVRNVSYIEHG